MASCEARKAVKVIDEFAADVVGCNPFKRAWSWFGGGGGAGKAER